MLPRIERSVMSIPCSLHHHGAVDGVTGSCHQLLLADGRSILVDCGLFQGAETSADGGAAGQLEIGFPVGDIQALVVTHVHIDHVGRILFNHEETFVTRKISRALARIKLGLQDCLYLGNLDAKRDWGHAKDYVEMQWLMLQQEKPEDFVIATGVQYSVRDFVDAAGKELGMQIRWDGKGVEEKGYDIHGKCIVAVDASYFRPTEVETLLGDPSKAKEKLGWTPKISFDELVAEMVREDLKARRARRTH